MATTSLVVLSHASGHEMSSHGVANETKGPRAPRTLHLLVVDVESANAKRGLGEVTEIGLVWLTCSVASTNEITIEQSQGAKFTRVADSIFCRDLSNVDPFWTTENKDHWKTILEESERLLQAYGTQSRANRVCAESIAAWIDGYQLENIKSGDIYQVLSDHPAFDIGMLDAFLTQEHARPQLSYLRVCTAASPELKGETPEYVFATIPGHTDVELRAIASRVFDFDYYDMSSSLEQKLAELCGVELDQQDIKHCALMDARHIAFSYVKLLNALRGFK